jgi:hypothetical protein
MQISKEKLIAQQLVLFHLGFYRGLIDGIWSSASIEAKKEFEASMLFLPAFPNGGLPFGERDKLPKGMSYQNGMIIHKDLSAEKALEIMNARKVEPKSELTPVKSEVPTVDDIVPDTSPSETSNVEPEQRSDSTVKIHKDHKHGRR